MTESEFLEGIYTNPFNAELRSRMCRMGLRECYITAGCLFQTIWNGISGHPPEWGIKDYDVFYFDDSDLSWEAEDRVIRLVAEATADLGVRVEVKNQARVHLWYARRFGTDYPRLTSSRHGIDLYLIACTCVGVDVHSGAVYATHGLEELAQGLLRMNPLHRQAGLFAAKAESYRSRWPWLTVVEDAPLRIRP